MLVKIAFPCLLAVLFCQATTVPEGILLDTFVDNLTMHETKTVINISGGTFLFTIQLNLVAILSCYGSRQISYPNILKCIIVDAS